MENSYEAMARPEPAKYLKFNKDDLEEYKRSLNDPWHYKSKIPLGFPVKSTTNSLQYNIPFSAKGTTGTFAGNVIGFATAGTDFVFFFNPNRFDDGSILQVSLTSAVPAGTLFTNWTNILPSKGFVANYSKYRLVSAGMRVVCTDAALYAKGIRYGYTTNLGANTEFGTGTTGYSTWQSTPGVEPRQISQGEIFRCTYEPVDFDCLSFIDTSIVDAARQDWCAYCSFSGYDATNGFSGFVEVVVNYELIVKGTSESLISQSINMGGDVSVLPDLVKESKTIMPPNLKASVTPSDFFSPMWPVNVIPKLFN